MFAHYMIFLPLYFQCFWHFVQVSLVSSVGEFTCLKTSGRLMSLVCDEFSLTDVSISTIFFVRYNYCTFLWFFVFLSVCVHMCVYTCVSWNLSDSLSFLLPNAHSHIPFYSRSSRSFSFLFCMHTWPKKSKFNQ